MSYTTIIKRLTIPVMAIAAAFSIGIAYQAQNTATKPEEIIVNQPETTPESTPAVSPEASSLPIVHDSPKTALAKSTATELVKQAAIAAPTAAPTPIQPAPEPAITPQPTPESNPGFYQDSEGNWHPWGYNNIYP